MMLQRLIGRKWLTEEGPSCLGSYESMILFLKEMIFRKEISNTAENNIFNNTPIFLVKQSCKSIKNFQLKRNSTKSNIFIRGDGVLKEG